MRRPPSAGLSSANAATVAGLRSSGPGTATVTDLICRVVADPSRLTLLRAELCRWLTRAGAASPARDDIILATSEACANSVEHAYVAEVGDLLLRANRGGEGHVTVTVRDTGRWKVPSAPGDRGRGLGIMRSVMDEVRVSSDAGGTTVTLVKRLERERPA